MADRPAATFGFKTTWPEQLTLAMRWQAEAPQRRWLLLPLILAGFAAATLVSKWASDEGDGRLESVLTTPLTRARWVARRS